MPVTVICPSCESKLKVGEQSVGKKIACPKCTYGFVAESSEGFAAERPKPVSPVVLARRPPPLEPPRRSRVSREIDEDEDLDRDDDFEERPRPHRKRRREPTGPRFLSRFENVFGFLALLALGVGGVMTWIGAERRGTASRAKEEPQEIRMADLLAKGAGDNAHVRIHEFELGHAFVFETNNKSKRWTQTWIPIFVRGANPKSTPVKIILHSYKPDGPNDIEVMARQLALTGVLGEPGSSIPSKEQDILRRDYPGTDFNNVMLFEEGKYVPSAGGALMLFLGGIATALIGAICGACWCIGRMQT